MKKWMYTIAALALLTLLLAACGGEKYEPHAINEETDVCAICKMAVKDDQFASQIVTKDGQSLKFDDIGCLNTWTTENGTDTIGASFVRDYHTKKWLRYENAYYAYDPSYKTPMAYGILSFEQEDEAQAYIAEQGVGVLMTADDLAGHSWEVNRDMMNMDGHGHGDGGHGDDGHGDGGHGDGGHGEGDAHGEGSKEHNEGADAHGEAAEHGAEQPAGGHAS